MTSESISHISSTRVNVPLLFENKFPWLFEHPVSRRTNLTRRWLWRITEHELNTTDANSDGALADTRLENNWLVPRWYRSVDCQHTVEHALWSTGRPRSSTEQSKQRGASVFKPQPPLSRRASLVEIGSSSTSSAPSLHPWRSPFHGENAASSFSSYSLFLSFCHFFALSFTSFSLSVVYLSLPGEFLTSSSLSQVLFPAPRCTRDSMASFFFLSTIGLSLSTRDLAPRFTIVSLSARFASQEHCI